MPDTIYLHAGPHKTGSTALQKALVESGPALAAKGLIYPRQGMSDFGHHQIVNAARGWTTEFDAAALAAECDGARGVILSSENVVHLTPSQLAAMKEMLPGGEVRVVYYLRRLADLWPSHWQELIKHGHWMSFWEYVSMATFALQSRRNIAIDQLQQIAQLASVFGRENVTILGYDALAGEKRDLAAHFLTEIAGVGDWPAQDGGQRVNASNPGWVTELVRAVNAVHRDETGTMATFTLRQEVLGRLRSQDDTFPMAEAFTEMVETLSRPVVIEGDGAVTRFLQRRLINQFGDRIGGDAEAARAAYMAGTTRSVQVFDMPLVGAGPEAIRVALRDWYLSFPEDARRGTPLRY